MQELSVTGATLLGTTTADQNSTTTTTHQQCQSHSHSHSHHHHHRHHHPNHGNDHHNHNTTSHDTTTSPSPLLSNHNNNDNHHHHQVVVYTTTQSLPTIQLKKPAKELVAEYTDAQLLTVVNQIVRLGSYDLLLNVVTAWREARPRSSCLTNPPPNRAVGKITTIISPSVVDQVLHSYDEAGHTLTHWAAKRVDDVRFISYFLNDVPFSSSSSSSTSSSSNEDGGGVDTDSANHHNNNNNHTTDTPRATTTTTTLYDDDNTAQYYYYYKSPLHRPTLDDTKMTPVHWVCTIGGRGAIAILKTMLLHTSSNNKTQQQQKCHNSHQNSNNNHHHGNNTNSSSSILEVRDGTHCTPLLIAAQHGHVDTCAYLLQQGADYAAVDSSRDTATHWAAYKGSELVLGLLSYYDTVPLSQPDAYGQTPLHLAALRGHAGTVRYIIQQLTLSASTTNGGSRSTTLRGSAGPRHRGGSRSSSTSSRLVALKDVLQMKDSNGRTPYELAVHKQQNHVADLLHQTMHPNYLRHYLSYRTCQSWLGLTTDTNNNTNNNTLSSSPVDLDESPQFPYYFVWCHIIGHFLYLFGVYWPIFDTGNGVLWDCLGWFVVQLTLMIGIIYVFRKTTYTNPGRLDVSHPAYDEYRKLYELAISGDNDDADTNDVNEEPLQLCHSCHIARPLRSKHCRITGTCVLAFDHHCPFVGTTVGLYNYTWFYSFLLLLTIYLVNFLILLILYYYRTLDHSASYSSSSHPIVTLGGGAVLGLHVFFPAGMLLYHTQLTGLNLTTNEHLNLYKYKYLRPHRPYSPWDRGFFTNFINRIVSPDERSYELANSAIQGLLEQHRGDGTSGGTGRV